MSLRRFIVKTAGVSVLLAAAGPPVDLVAAQSYPTRPVRIVTGAPGSGAEFAARVHDEYGLDARVLTGDEEAQLTFLGAMSGRSSGDDNEQSGAGRTHTVVIDVGGVG